MKNVKLEKSLADLEEALPYSDRALTDIYTMQQFQNFLR